MENSQNSTPSLSKSRSNLLRNRSFSHPTSSSQAKLSNYGSFGGSEIGEEDGMSLDVIPIDETSQDSGMFSPDKVFSPGCSPSNLLSSLNINKNNTPSPQVPKLGFGARAAGITKGRHTMKYLNDLLYRPIKTSFSECLSVVSATIEGKENSRKRKSEDSLCMLAGDESFKRPCPPSEAVPSKRSKALNLDIVPLQDLFNKSPHKGFTRAESKFETTTVAPPSPFQRSQSESSLSIKKALDRIDSDPLLIGDGSRRHGLPLFGGKNTDLKEISCDTLVDLITGIKKVDGRFQVIDCRYPYEYNGGHIKSALNIFTQKQAFEAFFTKQSKIRISNDDEFRVSDSCTRFVLIFHCEFSSHRAPDMCRFVRQIDRNANTYPFLHYPEMYVLSGGYKEFYEKFNFHCDPQVYVPMNLEEFSNDHRQCRAQMKQEVVSTKVNSCGRLSKFPGPARANGLKKLNI